MKSFFLTGIEYGYAMTTKLFNALSEQPSQEEGIKLLSHIIHAQTIWLKRLQDPAFKSPPIWDSMPPDELKARIEEDFINWKNYINSLANNEIEEKECTYYNMKGDKFTTKLKDIIFHVINHGTHHRGQISRVLREGGSVPPVTDYIFWVREK